MIIFFYEIKSKYSKNNNIIFFNIIIILIC
jgi:hypothetical protein